MEVILFHFLFNRFDINQINSTNKRLIDQLSKVLPFDFELTTLDFDLQYHADLRVTDRNGNTEYWLMRFRRYPYKDFTLRISAKRYKSEFEKILYNQTISKRYLHIVLDQSNQMSEVYIVNLIRLTSLKSFLHYVYQNQRKQNFVYITPRQLFENKLVDFYFRINGGEKVC